MPTTSIDTDSEHGSFDLAMLANGLDLEGLQIISASNSLAMPEGGASCCGGGSGQSCCCTCCC